MGMTKDLLKRLVKKVAKFSAVTAVALFIFSSVAMQAEAATAKVTASSVRVRKEASTSSDVVGSANNGESFTIQSEVTGSDGFVWYKVSVDGTTGYIRSDLAEKSGEGTGNTNTSPTISTEGVTQIQPISAKVTGDQVRVRPDASTNGSVVTTIAKDAVVTVNGTAEGSDNKTWYSVSFRSGNNDVNGFIREDFLQLAGEIVPLNEVTPEVPSEETPSVEIPEVPVEVKDYDTFEADGKWYLVNNTTSPAYQYVIEDVFDAAETNAALYEKSLKTVKTQKIFIILLVFVVVLGGVGATLVIFKMKDMLDEAYYEEVEKEVASKRQNKQQNVMHTVGKDPVQKKPTINGQQRPAAKGPQVNGQPKQMPKQQVGGTAPRPNAAQTAGQQKPGVKPQPAAQPRPAGTAQPQQKPAASTPAASTPAAQPKVVVNPQADNVQKPLNAAKPKQEFKSKNFATEEDDDFEYDFLNWDGDEEI